MRDVSRSLLIVSLLTLLAAACSEPAPPLTEAEIERQRALEVSERETQPTARELGEVITIVDGNLPPELEDINVAASCGEPVVREFVRRTVGASCATYEADITTFVERCVDDCDTPGLAALTVRAAAAACWKWCSGLSCGQRVSFIPPPGGCGAGDCFPSQRLCPDPDCPLDQYCSLLGGREVWNCFCRDLIPA